MQQVLYNARFIVSFIHVNDRATSPMDLYRSISNIPHVIILMTNFLDNNLTITEIFMDESYECAKGNALLLIAFLLNIEICEVWNTKGSMFYPTQHFK